MPGLRPSREERDDYYRSVIARQFIPFHLPSFSCSTASEFSSLPNSKRRTRSRLASKVFSVSNS